MENPGHNYTINNESIQKIADHLGYFNKNLLFSIYFVGNYKKYIKKNNQYHRNTSFNLDIN
jgi:hypothetical protein